MQGCRADVRLRPYAAMDVVIVWDNATTSTGGGGSGAEWNEQALRYTLRSIEQHQLWDRARRVHLLVPHAQPSFLMSSPTHAKLQVVPYSRLLGEEHNWQQQLAATSGGGDLGRVRSAAAAVQLRLHRIPQLAPWFLVVPVIDGLSHLPVLRRDWSDRSVFTTRIVANLELPLQQARQPQAPLMEAFGASRSAFLSAAASYDALIAAQVARGETWVDKGGRSAVVAVLPSSPFLVRKCLLDELAGWVMPGALNGTGPGSGLAPPNGSSEVFSLRGLSLNYALQRGQARLPSERFKKRLVCGAPELAHLMEMKRRQAAVAEKKRQKRAGKRRGKRPSSVVGAQSATTTPSAAVAQLQQQLSGWRGAAPSSWLLHDLPGLIRLPASTLRLIVLLLCIHCPPRYNRTPRYNRAQTLPVDL